MVRFKITNNLGRHKSQWTSTSTTPASHELHASESMIAVVLKNHIKKWNAF